MGDIRTNAAAAMLGVSPSTLRSWERRFGFPEPRRTAGGHRQYDLAQVQALRAAFEDVQNVSSAIAVARERGSGPTTPARLRSALARFDEGEADRVLEESLAVRSLERTVDEVLLPAVEGLEEGFAHRWATGWMAAARRAAPPATREQAIVLFDAAAPLSADALHAQALELLLRRQGLRTLTLTVGLDPSRLTRALHAVQPRAVVLAGRGAPLDALGRLVFAARRVAGDGLAVFDFRAALPETGASTVARLGERPLQACGVLVAELRAPAVVARTASPGRRARPLRAIAS